MLPREGTMVADRYRLRRKVGGGRVAATWQVYDETTKSLGVLKLLHRSMHNHPEALRRFSLEAQIARELTGPFFAERIDSGSWQSMRYIAWRWHQGECLRSRFERNPKQDAPTVHSVMKEVCEALSVVHAAGYAHADLKPENVFFAEGPEEPSSQLKLLGFGVAFPEEPRKGGSQRPQERRQGHIVGTPLYMSPDMLRGDVPIGSKADLWSLGVIVYEALTGRVPFLGNDLEETLEAILSRRSPRPSSVADVPATLDQWWARLTDQEFASAQEFSNALTKALEPALRSSRTQRSKLSPRALAAEGTLLANTDPSVIRNIDSAMPAMHSEPSAARTELHPVPRVEAPPPRIEAAPPRPEHATRLDHTRAEHTRGEQARPELDRAAQATSRPESSHPAPLHAATASHPVNGRPAADEQLAAFAPLPPLTDFLTSSKRTLLGIKPAQLDNKPRPTQQNMKAPARPSDADGVMLYRNIEISEPDDSNAPANDHHTVPFPRPAFAMPRRSAFGHRLEPAAEQTYDSGSRASSKTMEHLPAFLIGGDRRHQWIAAAVVCTVAAAVLLLTGRSNGPLIEQSRNSLTAEQGENPSFQEPFATKEDEAPTVPVQAERQPATPPAAQTSEAAATPPSEPRPAPTTAPLPPAPRAAPVEPPRAAPPAAHAAPPPARVAPPAPRATQPPPARTAPTAEPSKARPTTPEPPRPTTPKPPSGASKSGDPGEFDFGF